MSGTSLDGVDVALIEADGERIADFGPAFCVAGLMRTPAFQRGRAPIKECGPGRESRWRSRWREPAFAKEIPRWRPIPMFSSSSTASGSPPRAARRST
jgi:hypothetical protein